MQNRSEPAEIRKLRDALLEAETKKNDDLIWVVVHSFIVMAVDAIQDFIGTKHRSGSYHPDSRSGVAVIL